MSPVTAAPTDPAPVPDTETWRVANAAWLADSLRLLRLRLHRHALLLRDPRAGMSTPVEDWLVAGDAATGGESPATALDPRIGAETEQLAASEAALRAAGTPPALRVLADAVGLSPFEADVLLLAAAPSLDGAFAPAYAELHGDTRRDHATLHLALSVFAPVRDRLVAADCLLPARPLRRLRLLQGLDEVPADGLLAPLVVDRRMADYLRGVNRLDGRLDAVAVVVPVPRRSGDADGDAAASRLASVIGERLAADPSRWPVLNLVGAADSDAEEAVARAGAGLGLRVARLDLEALSGLEPDRRAEILALLGREAVMADLTILVDATGVTPRSPGAAVVDLIVRRLDAPLILVSPERWPAGGALLDVIPVGRPTRAEQRSIWRTALIDVPNSVNGELDAIVEQFDFGPTAIREVVARAARDGGAVSGVDLWDACRVQNGPALDELARRILPVWGWDDIVVGDSVRAQLRELADQVAHRARVYEQWGFGAQLGRGRGITALFAGPTGTGKTMAAEIIAGQLRLDLYRVDLAGVVSKYVGETEKNLRRVFDAAEASGAILLFDEADALFGTRTEVRDSHDRYANLEINYLLQRMEDYAGLAILATNRRAALDSAFLRRLRFIVDFPFPDQDDRQRIWSRAFPVAADLDELDLGSLSRLELSGGNIRSIAINAAFLAAAEDGPIGMTHVMRAAAREYGKLGRPISTADFGDWSTVARP